MEAWHGMRAGTIRTTSGAAPKPERAKPWPVRRELPRARAQSADRPSHARRLRRMPPPQRPTIAAEQGCTANRGRPAHFSLTSGVRDDLRGKSHSTSPVASDSTILPSSPAVASTLPATPFPDRSHRQHWVKNPARSTPNPRQRRSCGHSHSSGPPRGPARGAGSPVWFHVSALIVPLCGVKVLPGVLVGVVDCHTLTIPPPAEARAERQAAHGALKHTHEPGSSYGSLPCAWWRAGKLHGQGRAWRGGRGRDMGASASWALSRIGCPRRHRKRG